MEITDSGGVAAKYGFLYQDCVAALLATEMLMDKRMRAIRVETVDDIDILWLGSTEFIQVKAAADKKWSPTSITENATSTAASTANFKTSGKSRKKRLPGTSIVHKSMNQAFAPIEQCKFRVISAERPSGLLEYLRVELHSRSGRPGRQELIEDLNNRTTSYRAFAGNDITHWVDSTWWQVFPSLREIELLGIKNIRNAACEVVGVTLNSDAAAEIIWRDIIYTVTKKSTLSRKIYCEDDKTYHRSNLLDWFKNEIVFHEKTTLSRNKIYAHKKPPPILLQIYKHTPSCGSTTRCGKVMHQHYSMRNYRYAHIANCIVSWIDEVLLMPDEITDFAGLSTIRRYKTLTNRLKSSMSELEKLIGKILLHSCIRHYSNSQPIPASLYVEHPSEVRVLENVHIVPNSKGADELWVGFSYLLDNSNVTACVQDLRSKLYNDIKDNFDKARSRILEIKQDSYLLAHDINETLDVSQPFDKQAERYRFIIFLGYNSTSMTNPETIGYEAELEKETKILFDDFASDISTSGFDQVQIELHLYPAPSINDLLGMVKTALENACA